MLPTTACPAGLLAHTSVTNCHYYRCIEATVSIVSSHILQCDLQVSSSKVTLTRGSDGTDLTRNRHLTDDSSIGSYKYEVMQDIAPHSRYLLLISTTALPTVCSDIQEIVIQ
jgi:hypothetical protein